MSDATSHDRFRRAARNCDAPALQQRLGDNAVRRLGGRSRRVGVCAGSRRRRRPRRASTTASDARSIVAFTGLSLSSPSPSAAGGRLPAMARKSREIRHINASGFFIVARGPVAAQERRRERSWQAIRRPPSRLRRCRRRRSHRFCRPPSRKAARPARYSVRRHADP